MANWIKLRMEGFSQKKHQVLWPYSMLELHALETNKDVISTSRSIDAPGKASLMQNACFFSARSFGQFNVHGKKQE